MVELCSCFFDKKTLTVTQEEKNENSTDIARKAASAKSRYFR